MVSVLGMTKRLSTARRVSIVAGGVLLCSYVSALLALQLEIKRASQLFEEIHNVRIGDTEQSIKPLIERYGGRRWDVQVGAFEDYNYALVVNPWWFPSLTRSKLADKFHTITLMVNPRTRAVVGLRMWYVGGEISIKDHRVVAVQSETVVEAKYMWLGAMWRSSDKPREFERSADAPDKSPPREDFVSSGILDMANGTGTSWDFWTTSSSPEVQTRMARVTNFECLHPFSTCETPCDLLPEATESFRTHPKLALRGGGWDENLRTCTKRDASNSLY
jgi:hypothetical protein